MCEELWNPQSSHIAMGLDGVEIICNSSGSYMELRKAYVTVDLVKSATMKSGGCYIFSNLRGCDGQRIYFNGCSCIAVNGHMINRSKQFALEEVVSTRNCEYFNALISNFSMFIQEVISSTIDLEEIRTYRNRIRSRCVLASSSPAYPRIVVDFSLSPEYDTVIPTTIPIECVYLKPEEEIAQVISLFLM